MRRWRIAASSTLLVLAALAAAEVRLAGYRSAQDEKQRGAYADFLIDNETPVFRRTTVDGEPFFVSRRKYEKHLTDGQKIPVRKALGVKRVAVIGESSALAFARDLRVKAESDGLPLEVASLGVAGGSIEQVERRFEEALGLEPDMVVLLFGHNLLKTHPRVRPWPHRLGRLIRRSRLISFLADAWPEKATDPVDPAERRRRFEAFLGRFAARARERGAVPVAATMGSNLLFPPGEAADASDGERLATQYALAAGGVARVLARLEEDAGDGPSAARDFAVGVALYRAGDYRRAGPLLVRARDHSDSEDRLTTEMNEGIRRAARAAGAELLDIDALVRKAAPHGIPGWESFNDHVHLSGAANRAAVSHFLSTFGEKLLGKKPVLSADRVAARFEWEKLVRAAFERGGACGGVWWRAVSEGLPRALEEDPAFEREFERLLGETAARRDGADLAGCLALRGAEAFRLAGRPAAAARLLDRGRARRPEWGGLDVEEGFLALQAGDPVGARSSFAAACDKQDAEGCRLLELATGPLH